MGVFGRSGAELAELADWVTTHVEEHAESEKRNKWSDLYPVTAPGALNG